jgi:tetratricopeptide (TPR) repeat protein
MNRIAVGVLLIVAFGLVLGCSAMSEEELVDQAKILEEQQEYKEALKVYQRLLRQYPKGEYAAEAQYKIGWIYYNEDKDFKKAVEAHEKLVQNYPDSRYAEQSRFMIGYIYANDLRDFEKARAAYEDFLNNHPKSELADDVAWELEHLGQDINLLDFVGNEEGGKSADGKSGDSPKKEQ